MLFQSRSLPGMLSVDAPQAHSDAQHTREQGNVVCLLIAYQTLLATAVAVRLNDGVRVVHSTVEEVVDIATNNRGPRQETPVDREAVGAESVDHNCWKDAKGDAVRETAET